MKTKLRTFHLWGYCAEGDKQVIHSVSGEFRAHAPAAAILQFLKSRSVLTCPFDRIEAKPAVTRIVSFR